MSDPTNSSPVATPPAAACEQCRRLPASTPHSCPNAEKIFHHHDPNYCNCCPSCTLRCEHETKLMLDRLAELEKEPQP